MKFYRVHAYRWGWTNNSNYHVWAGDDRSSAFAHAEAESHSRGGKYGVTVYELDGEEEKPIHHAPSSYGEDRAHTNWRLEMFRTVGQFVACELEDDKYPSRADVEGRMKHENEIHEMYRKAEEKNAATAAGL